MNGKNENLMTNATGLWVPDFAIMFHLILPDPSCRHVSGSTDTRWLRSEIFIFVQMWVTDDVPMRLICFGFSNILKFYGYWVLKTTDEYLLFCHLIYTEPKGCEAP